MHAQESLGIHYCWGLLRIAYKCILRTNCVAATSSAHLYSELYIYTFGSCHIYLPRSESTHDAVCMSIVYWIWVHANDRDGKCVRVGWDRFKIAQHKCIWLECRRRKSKRPTFGFRILTMTRFQVDACSGVSDSASHIIAVLPTYSLHAICCLGVVKATFIFSVMCVKTARSEDTNHRRNFTYFVCDALIAWMMDAFQSLAFVEGFSRIK